MRLRVRGTWVLAAVCLVGLWALVASQGRAQAPAAGGDAGKERVAFEVATIKPIDPKIGQILGFHAAPGGRVNFGAVTVKTLIFFAFEVQAFQIVGGPPWIGTDRYNVEAIDPTIRSSEGPSLRATPTAVERTMLQGLLMERFGLKVHRSAKEGPVLLLVRGTGRLNLREPKDKESDSRGGVIMRPGGVSDGQAFGQNISMKSLASQLSRALGQVVVDQTSLEGTYDFEVPASDTNQEYADAVFDSMQRLGLKLKAGKGMVDTVVIDEVSRPTEN